MKINSDSMKINSYKMNLMQKLKVPTILCILTFALFSCFLVNSDHGELELQCMCGGCKVGAWQDRKETCRRHFSEKYVFCFCSVEPSSTKTASRGKRSVDQR